MFIISIDSCLSIFDCCPIQDEGCSFECDNGTCRNIESGIDETTNILVLFCSLYYQIITKQSIAYTDKSCLQDQEMQPRVTTTALDQAKGEGDVLQNALTMA